MAIEMDRVLTASARDYIASSSSELGEYEMVGVHSVRGEADGLIEFLDSAPEGTEVITDFRIGPTGTYHGTALVPLSEDRED